MLLVFMAFINVVSVVFVLFYHCSSWFAKIKKLKFEHAHPLKIFLLMYRIILIYIIFLFEGPFYESQHGSHRPSFVSVQQCCQLVKMMFLSILSIL